MRLLEIPEVRKELNLSDDQQAKVDELLREFLDESFAAFSGTNFQELGELTDEERERRFAEMQDKSEKVTRAARAKLDKLLDAKQLARFRQLELQREGPRGLNRPDIARALSLSETQLSKLRELQPEPRGQFGFAPPREGNRGDALAVLTDAQRAKWTEMQGPEFKFPEQPGFGPGGFGPGRGGPAGPMRQEQKIAKKFDKDGNGFLNAEERTAARESLQKERAAGGGRGPGFGGPRGPGAFGPPGGPPGGPGRPGGPGGPGGPGRGREEEPARPGSRVSPDDVQPVAGKSLYDPAVVRTLFLDFEAPEWEAELADFYGTDVEVPATLTVDGRKYPQVGAGFRGMSSYFTVRPGHKRSLNLSLDLVDNKQRLYGYKTLNLLNSHEDPTFLHTVLFFDISRKYIPAPKANFVRLVVNGESWGLYVNVQQFNSEFIAEHFPDASGARWKVRGSPRRGRRARLPRRGNRTVQGALRD